ncbi:MAG: ATP-binding protein [Methylacidiphilales bacterium]|nr:ATP-binding protein [Candidatus Methylacidiphilales bacterium]MDW8349627.1 ATP-binding protein [Verrucomicrobiae bacterium]
MSASFFSRLIRKIDRLSPQEVRDYIKRLTSEKGFLETIFNTLLEGVLVLDAQGHILYANRRSLEIFGLRDQPDKLQGQPIQRYLRELNWPELLGQGNALTREIEIHYPDHRYLKFYLVPVEQDAPQKSYAAIFYDITSQQQATRENIESEKINALTLLAAGVAHELGNPLNSLQIHIQLIERELKKISIPAKTAQSIETVKNELQRLNGIIDRFLRAIRPSSANLQLTPLHPVLREALEFMKHEIENRDVILEEEYASNIPPLLLDAEQLKQALYNLVKNSLQAMPAGGILRICTRLTERHVEILIQDNGAGIAPENLPRLFEPYFTTKESGSGLGLLIVKRIVNEHHGELQIESRLGSGTTVKILLPLPDQRFIPLPPSAPPTALLKASASDPYPTD